MPQSFGPFAYHSLRGKLVSYCIGKYMKKAVSNIIKEWKTEAGVKGIVLVGAFSEYRSTIKICTDRPGLMIGKCGELVDKYKNKLRVHNPKLETIEFVETDSWYVR